MTAFGLAVDDSAFAAGCACARRSGAFGAFRAFDGIVMALIYEWTSGWIFQRVIDIEKLL